MTMKRYYLPLTIATMALATLGGTVLITVTNPADQGTRTIQVVRAPVAPAVAPEAPAPSVPADAPAVEEPAPAPVQLAQVSAAPDAPAQPAAPVQAAPAPAPTASCDPSYHAEPAPPAGYCTWQDWSNDPAHDTVTPPAPYTSWLDYMNRPPVQSFVPSGKPFDMNDPSTFPKP